VMAAQRIRYMTLCYFAAGDVDPSGGPLGAT
jgi:hypothetical protein